VAILLLALSHQTAVVKAVITMLPEQVETVVLVAEAVFLEQQVLAIHRLLHHHKETTVVLVKAPLPLVLVAVVVEQVVLVVMG
jgi:hypothetical protein